MFRGIFLLLGNYERGFSPSTAWNFGTLGKKSENSDVFICLWFRSYEAFFFFFGLRSHEAWIWAFGFFLDEEGRMVGASCVQNDELGCRV